jgi:LmbE family N-acetylglucosaminyl deacetylase/GT2 family glycosyltransferase
MAVEADAIPFEPSRLRGERLLVLAPHPDDEVIGCGGLVAQHFVEGRSVRVIVATDGGQAGVAADREEESRRAIAALAGAHSASVDFLRFPDRELGSRREEFGDRLADILRDYAPDLIVVASPVEIHPDHLALGVAFCELIQRDPSLFAELAVARVAFFEVGQPLRPNTIVDITEVADAKYAAIAEHKSQLAVRDYVAYARGLNAYRAMTMPPEVKFAEAYFVMALPEIRTTAVATLQKMMGDARGIAIETDAPLPISVVVRTKDRPALLREAIESIRATNYPCEIVVVNDGGARLWSASDSPAFLDRCKLIEHETSLGRSEAANAGVRAASNAFIAFLDDDDLFYPDHLATLARAANGSQHAAWYTEALSAFVRTGATGALETHKRLRIFGQDFDRDALLVDNYIPLPTLLFRRDDFLALGGFDREFDLFEDWDFLIRLAQRGAFVHVPRVTCEIRQIEGAGSITMSAPEGSPKFHEAKMRVWQKHAELMTSDVFANAIERQKRRIVAMQSETAEARGVVHHLETDITRLTRDNTRLAADLQASGSRISAVEGGAEAVGLALRETERDNERKALEIERLLKDNEELRAMYAEAQEAVRPLYAEIHRLNALLEQIYTSRTWKLHNMVERVKGR